MKRLLGLGAFLLTAGLSVPAVHAQPYVNQGFSETASATSFVASPDSIDSSGNVTALATVDGSLAGTPVNGSFHLEENRTHGEGAPSGQVQGTFVLQDGGGNTLTGSLNGQFMAGPSGSTSQGQYSITGGSGVFAGASGSGNFVDQLAGPGANPVISLTGVWAVQNPSYSSNPYLPSYAAPTEQVVIYVPVDTSSVNPQHGWDGHDNGLHKGWFKHGHGHDHDDD